MTTYSAKPADIVRRWYVIDAEGLTLGRLCTRLAVVLRGKDKPIFTPHMDCGDYVIVVNAEKIRVTGNKLATKMYYSHSGYPGGLRETTLQNQLIRHPERVISEAVRRMLPKNALSRDILRKLKIYAGADHPHVGQNPETLSL